MALRFDIPQVRTNIPSFATHPSAASELSRMMSGIGTRVGTGATGTGAVRTTKEERQALAEQQARLYAMQLVQQDQQLQEKLARLQAAPVDTQKTILQDIRRSDIKRIAETTGIDTAALFDAALGPLQAQVNQRYKDVTGAAGITGSGLDSLRMGLNEMTAAFRAVGKSNEEARAIGRQTAQENAAIVSKNPYLQDQQKREQAGELITGSGATGSYLANLMRLAPQMAGMIGGTLGGAAAGTAVGGPAGGVVGGIATAGSLGAVMGAQDFVTRVENDPRLTPEQKAEAIATGRIPAAVAAGVFNAVPINANPASQAALRAASGTILGRVAETLGRSAAGRVVGNTLLSGAELSAANVGDVLSRNIIYGRATGQDSPVTEGLGQALVQGAAMAPFFGVARGWTHGIPVTEAPPPAVVPSPAPPVAPVAPGTARAPRSARGQGG